jgi:hypothetical protein
MHLRAVNGMGFLDGILDLYIWENHCTFTYENEWEQPSRSRTSSARAARLGIDPYHSTINSMFTIIRWYSIIIMMGSVDQSIVLYCTRRPHLM